MQLINGKVRLSELAKELEVTPSAIRQHAQNPKNPLGEGAEKFGHRTTGDVLLSIKSVKLFLEWLRAKSRKVSMENIDKVEKNIKYIEAYGG